MVKRSCVILMAFVLALFAAFACAACSQDVEYEPETKNATVLPPTIKQEDVLRVGVNTNNSPLAGMSNDEIVGIDADIAAYLADSLGLKLQLVDVGENPDDALSAGTVDIVMGVDEESEVFESLWASEEYLSKCVVLFSLTSSAASAPRSATGVTVAAQVSSTSSWAVTNVFDESVLVSTTNLQEAFSLLDQGEVDFVAADAVTGLYVSHIQGLDVEMTALLTNPSGYHIATSPDNVDLQAAVSAALEGLQDDGIIDVIENKWLGCTLDLSAVPRINITSE